MYQITIDNGGERQILHTDDPNSRQRISSGTLKEYVGSTPSLTLTVTPQNACYNMLIDRNTLVELKNTETGEIEFEGYLLKSPESMTNKGTLQKKLTFEGYLGYLNDSVQEYHTYTDQDALPAQFLTALLEYHNAVTEERKHIYLGEINAGQGGSKTTAYRSTLAEIKENLVGRFGGELRVRRGADGRLLLDYLTAAQNASTSDTVIMLGHNLKSLSIESDTTNIITRLMPLGAQLGTVNPATGQQSAERLTVTGAVDPDDGHTYTVPYIDDPAAIAKYGVIVGTAEFDDITVKENLVARGKAYLAENNRVRKHYAASVLDISGKGRIRCGDTYRFRHPVMGLDENLRLLGRTVDLLKPWTPQVEIGDKTAKITSVAAKTQHMIDYELPQQLSQTVQTAKQIAGQLINAATTGYVVLRPNEILIMDTDDVATATRIWRWNSGGLGYTKSDVPGEAYGMTPTVAIAMNGEIAAEFIASGTMFADRIRGGTLAVGGAGGQNGVIQVLDDNGTEICRLDKNGASILGSLYTNNAQGYWIRIADGKLTGGRNSDTYASLDASAHITNEDTHQTYNGLLINAGAIDFRCNMFAVNSYIGGTGSITVLTGAGGRFVTDIQTDNDGHVTNVEYGDVSTWSHTLNFCSGLMNNSNLPNQ